MAEQTPNDMPNEAEPMVTAPAAAEPETVPVVTEPELWDDGEDFGDDEPRVNTGLVATFLPGIDAGAVIALVLSVLGALAYVFINPLLHASADNKGFNDARKKVAASQDPFVADRLFTSYESWAHIALGLAALLIALLVLGSWTVGRNALWARSVAQAALVLGLMVLVYGILLKTGVVGGIPDHKTVQDFIDKSTAAAGAAGGTG